MTVIVRNESYLSSVELDSILVIFFGHIDRIAFNSTW